MFIREVTPTVLMLFDCIVLMGWSFEVHEINLFVTFRVNDSIFRFTGEQIFGSIELLIELDANVTTFSSQAPLFISSIASELAVLPAQVRSESFFTGSS